MTKIWASSPDVLIPFFRPITTGNLRNNQTGELGGEFVLPFPVTISYLGRRVAGVNANDHIVTIWRNSDQSIKARATIVHGSAQDAFNYIWTPITPVVLNAGTLYVISSGEDNAGDQWKDTSLAVAGSLVYAAIIQQRWSAAKGVFPANTFNNFGQMYNEIGFK